MTGNEDPPPVSTPRVPYLLRFLGLNMALGTAIGAAFVSLILLANVAGLKDLIAGSGQPLLPLFLLYFFNALTFASVAMGVAIMRLPYER